MGSSIMAANFTQGILQSSKMVKQVREPISEETALLPGEYRGRDGEILRRPATKFGANPFDVPDDVKEDGWSYQWVRYSCYGNTDYSELSTMKRAGWREVHPDALNGYFREETPSGQNHILKEGLVLVERPEGMTRDAIAENERIANETYARQMHTRYDPDAPLPEGMAEYVKNVDIEDYQPAPRAWKPQHRPRAAMPVGDE